MACAYAGVAARHGPVSSSAALPEAPYTSATDTRTCMTNSLHTSVSGAGTTLLTMMTLIAGSVLPSLL